MPILGGCLCLDLPTGTKIIGAIYLISALVNTLALTVINLMLWTLNFLPALIDLLENMTASQKEQSGGLSNSENDHVEFSGNSSSSSDELRELVDMIKEHSTPVLICILVLLILAILSVITSSMLIHGVRKNCRGLLIPWILQEIIHIFIALVLVGFFFWLLGTDKVAWTLSLPTILGIFIQIFFIIVVVSQFQALGLIRMHDEMCMK